MPNAATFKACLDVLYYSGASAALRNVFGGIGAIFMLHHILPDGGRQRGFAPNAVIELGPEFLDRVLGHVRSLGFDLVTLGEAIARVRNGNRGRRPFAAITLDDGYRDNLVHARPVFQRHGCPYAIFIAPAITDGDCRLWWRGLEYAIARSSSVHARINGQDLQLPAETVAQKYEAWHRLYWPVRRLDQHLQRQWIGEFCDRHGVDLRAICLSAAMTWAEVREAASDPLCTIGAHTVNHYALSRLPGDEALAEMVRSASRIEAELGRRPEFLAYPYGDELSAGPRDFALAAEAGFSAAVTTRKGLVYAAHSDHLMALPRVSLPGGFQKLRYVQTLLSGAPFVMFNGLRTLNVN